MEQAPYNYAGLSDEKIDKHYRLSHDSVKAIENAVLGNFPLEDTIEIIKNNISHLEALIGFNCWDGKDISSWHTAIQEGKNYLESAATE